jgi:hypothetical protein
MPALSLRDRNEAERIMATKQSSAGRGKSGAGSRRLAAAAQQAVERAEEAKRRVRDAKAELKSLRKLAKVAKKAAKAALKKAKAAKPAAPARAVPVRSAAARTAAAASVRASATKSRRRRRTAKGSVPRRQPAEVARSVIRRMQKRGSGISAPVTASAVAREAGASAPRSLPDSAGTEAVPLAQTAAP